MYAIAALHSSNSVIYIFAYALLVLGLSFTIIKQIRNSPPISRLKRFWGILCSACLLVVAIFVVILSEKMEGSKLFGGQTGYIVAMCVSFAVGFLGLAGLFYNVIRFICGKQGK